MIEAATTPDLGRSRLWQNSASGFSDNNIKFIDKSPQKINYL